MTGRPALHSGECRGALHLLSYTGRCAHMDSVEAHGLECLEGRISARGPFETPTSTRRTQTRRLSMSATDRLTRLRESLAGREVDAILISAPENRRYVSGFTGSAGYLLVSEGDAVLATDFRYVEQAGRQAPGFRVERIAAAYDWLPKLTSGMGVRRLGFESHDLSVATHTRLAKAIQDSNGGRGPDTVPVDGVVEGLRAVKDPEEMSLLAKAVEIADCALDRVAPTIEPGVL